MAAPLATVVYDVDRIAGHHCEHIRQSFRDQFCIKCYVSPSSKEESIEVREETVDPSDFNAYITSNTIDAVLVFSTSKKEGSLTAVVATCLERGCHVFTVTPEASEVGLFKNCFHVAKTKQAMLFCGNSRRYDTRLKRFRQMYRSGAVSMPQHVEVAAKGNHLGKHRDFVRDIDLLTWVLGEYPSRIQSKEGRSHLEYPSGITATITSEIPDGVLFEHRMQVFGEKTSCLSVSNVDREVLVANAVASSSVALAAAIEEAPRKRQKIASSSSTSSSTEVPDTFPLSTFYLDPYEEVAEFYHAVVSFSAHNALSVENLLASYVIAEAAKTADACSESGLVISYSQLEEFDIFRDYAEAPETVKECYRLQRIFQTEEYVDRILKRYCKFDRKGSFWDLFDMLSTFVDLSDPDINLSNHQHLFQTAEGIRKDGLPEWMQVTGLIHDLGKIIYKIGRPEDGTTMESQWGIVGDTYIVGCKIPESIVYPEFNELNPDMKDPLKGSDHGIYKPGQGLSTAKASFGHDEYLYQLLRRNKVDLPEEAYYMVRFHSLYPWHKENAYAWLEDDTDRRMKWWVRLFNKYDLYTKAPRKVDEVAARAYYGRLVKKYFKDEIMW